MDYTNPPVITTPRLILTPYTKNEIYSLYDILNQLSVKITSNGGNIIINIDKAIEEIDMRLKGEHDCIYYGIHIKNMDGSMGKLIGTIGIHHMFSTNNGLAEIGYRLSTEYRNKGYAKEALTHYINLLNSLPKDEIKAKVKENFVLIDNNTKDIPSIPLTLTACLTEFNKPSRKLLESLGFELVKGEYDKTKKGISECWYRKHLK
jgi:RimJ/RimL family protein N-acetyltransferase